MVDSYLTNPESHPTRSSVEGEKAWYILGILLSIGFPVCPQELASRCELFNASPEFVQFLCSIANSPLHLMENGLVTASLVAVSAFEQFVSKVIVGGVSRIGIRFLGCRRSLGSDVKTYFRKRKGAAMESLVLSTAKRRPSPRVESIMHFGSDRILRSFLNSIQGNCTEEPVDIASIMMKKTSILTVNLPVTEFDTGDFREPRDQIPLLDSNAEFASFPVTNIKHNYSENNVGTSLFMHKEALECHDTSFRLETNSNVLKSIQIERVASCKPDLRLALPSGYGALAQCRGTEIDDNKFGNDSGFPSMFCLEVHEQNSASLLETKIQNSQVPVRKSKTDEENLVKINGKEGDFTGYGRKGDSENLVPVDKCVGTEAQTNWFGSINEMHMITSDKDQTIRNVNSQATFPLPYCSSARKKSSRSSGKLHDVHKNALCPKPQVLVESLNYNKAVNNSKQLDQCKSNQKFPMEQKLKQSRKHNMHAKENIIDTTSIFTKNQLENKALPLFESFIMEEEEGSGGYGTVYRVQRKTDGKRLAIKCPHVNANMHFVHNELKMLKQFGGRNFIIKYEGSFKHDNSECFVLEHVEHDRPEVLKKEIDIFQMQWYGYCMFRALACLHKQGVVHRDVKPGNFLFSRKLNKGYLIDFNLAMDLQQKYIGSESKLIHNVSLNHVPLPHSKSAMSSKDKKLVGSNFAAANIGTKVDSKPTHEHTRNVKKQINAGFLKVYRDLGVGNVFRSQAADGSGITSTRDVTSTRTTPAERLREPLPCHGRKELINLVQDAMQSPNDDALKSFASQRKRITDSPGKMGNETVYISPMPLHSSGAAVAGAGLLKSKGGGKHKRDGTCVGTKGFRAPEVLLRSVHQSLKLDIWSAGVTLLYLILGRTPFTGDPEQNIKDIAKLRGSEDLWEVAKLHDCESSFPVELLDMKSLPSMELQSWCRIHTKRPDCFKLIPNSLFDLIEKCLTVNPRQRISAEEALRHEFFASCHESQRKLRMLKRGLSLDSNCPK